MKSLGELKKEKLEEYKDELSKKSNDELIMFSLFKIIPCCIDEETRALKQLLWERSRK